MFDERSLQAFEAAAQHLNFTRAAKTAAMTQSGISQHIARIEEDLGAPLFTRVNRKVFLTNVGKILLDHIEQEREIHLRLQEKIHGETLRVDGVVRYAMPNSCLLTPHLSRMLDQREQFPELRFEITLCPNEEIFAKLLENEIDFGFVTKTIKNPGLEFEAFCQEEYILVGKSRKMFENAPQLNYISYPGMDALYRLWAKHHLPQNRRICPTALRYTGKINSITGAITMVEKGLGVTVIPRHCVESQLKSGNLVEFRAEKRKALFNHIYLVSLKDRAPTARVRALYQVFRQIKGISYH